MVRITRYQGSKIIKKLVEEGQFIEAYVHTQLGVERILWDKIVGSFDGDKARLVRKRIESRKTEKDRFNIGTHQLITWAYFIGAITENEKGNLIDFNKKRNDLIHGHGQWWFSKTYIQALRKGISFLEKNGL